MLTEKRVMTFYADPKVRMFDVDITLTAIDEPVTFGDGKDGVFGIRLRPVLQEDKGKLRTSPTPTAWSARRRYGASPPTGAIIRARSATRRSASRFSIIPANPRHPVRWHARAYGLFAANPFGLSVFTNDKTQNGAMTVEPGKSLRYRYRVIIHEGDVKDADIAAQWTKYSGGK